MASEQVQPGLVIAGRYRVERQLGEGGMGSVFLVSHVHTDERLALKVLHKAVIEDSVAKERFQREARTPARIDSDHVVRVTDADVAAELGGAPFLVMEYLRGQDLEQLVVARGPVPPLEVVLYLRQAARALDKAHALGIIHRDLKPENLFLTEREDGTPWIKVLDFGIAKLTKTGDVATKTATGQIFGTPMFMSPEQALAESAKISPQTDVWALGLIAHKLLTGTDVWSADNLTQLVAQIAFQPMPVPSERGAPLGTAYDAWFARCCARDVAARYTSAGEAVTELAKALGVVEPRAAGPLGQSAIVPPSDLSPEAMALAKTSQAASDALKFSAGPLTRSDTQMGAAPPRRRRTGLLVALGVVAAGIAGAAWLLSGLPSNKVSESAAKAGENATEPPKAPDRTPAVSAARPAAAPVEVAPARSAAPTIPQAESSEAMVAPPRPSGRPAKGASGKPVASASAAPDASASAPASASPAASAPASAKPAASAAPSAKPAASAAPSAKPSAAPSASASAKPGADPLGGRH